MRNAVPGREGGGNFAGNGKEKPHLRKVRIFQRVQASVSSCCIAKTCYTAKLHNPRSFTPALHEDRVQVEALKFREEGPGLCVNMSDCVGE